MLAAWLLIATMVAACLLSPRTLKAETGRWTPAGLAGVQVANLLVDPANPATVLAATADGVYRTDDGGASWALVLAEPSITHVAGPGNLSTLYAKSLNGLWRSLDGGTTWALRYDNSSPRIGHVAVDPQSPTTLYAGSADGFVKSTDGGGTWTAVNVGLPVPRPPGPTGNVVHGMSVVVAPDASGTIYGIVRQTDGTPVPRIETATLFKSTDGAGMWQAMPLVSATLEPVVSVADPSVLYARSHDRIGASFVAFSRDAGETWSSVFFLRTDLRRGRQLGPLAVDPDNVLVLYAARRHDMNDVLRSTDGGFTWASTNAALASEPRTLAITTADPRIVYAGTDAGVFRFDAPGTGPDLTGSWRTARGACHARPGRTRCKLAGVFRLRNAGTDRLRHPIVIRFYASADERYDDQDTLVAERMIAKLGRGRNRRVPFRVRTDGASAAAAHLIARIDDENAVEETREGNNLIPFTAARSE